jgi:adenine-specific DNA-methyltransferase
MTAIKREERIGGQRLMLGDCMEIMQELGPVDAVVTDPPYGKVKGDFDNAWTNRAAMLPDVERWLDAIVDRIKPNGTLWWFAWPSLAGRIEDRIARRMNVLSHVVWQKPAATGQKTRKESLRAPMPLTERIIMAEHYGADNAALGVSGYQAKCDELRGFVFEPLRAYLAEEWARAGLTAKDLNEATSSQMAGHYLTKVQWALPTEKNYRIMQERANLVMQGEYLRKEYEELRKEYEELRKEYEELRRYFDCRAGDQFSDVWNFSSNKDATGHPTTKPLALMEYLVRLSVRPSGVCLDPFMGSGTTLVACQRLGRQGIGIEIDPEYFDIACRRVEEATRQPDLFIEQPKPEAPKQEGFDL